MMGILSDIFMKVRGTEITAAQAPRLLAAVEEIAASVGLKEIPKVYLADIPQFRHIPLAAGGKNSLLFNHHMFDAMGTTMHGEVTPALKAIIGHEFSHIKRFWWDGKISLSLPILLAPAAAVTGYHWHEKAQASAGLAEDRYRRIDDIATAERDDLNAAYHAQQDKTGFHHDTHHWLESLITPAKYAAVAMGGLGVGLLAARQFSLACEYAADRAGAKVASPDAMKGALVNLVDWFRAMPPSEMVAAKASQMSWLIRETLHAHPTIAQRIARL